MKKIEVCIGTACYLKGSYNIIEKIQDMAEKNGIAKDLDVSAVFCLGKCAEKGASIRIGESEIHSVIPDNLETFFKEYILK